MKENYIIYIGFILLPNLLSAQFVHTIKLDTTGNEELVARIFEIDLNNCDTGVVCAITFARGDIV